MNSLFQSRTPLDSGFLWISILLFIITSQEIQMIIASVGKTSPEKYKSRTLSGCKLPDVPREDNNRKQKSRNSSQINILHILVSYQRLRLICEKRKEMAIPCRKHPVIKNFPFLYYEFSFLYYLSLDKRFSILYFLYSSI